MADGKLTYDIDFNVNTEAISSAIARAVAQATSARAHLIDTAVSGLAERVGSDYVYQNVRDTFAAVTPGGETIADFAAMAADSPYRYKPSTIQSMIRNEAAKAAAQYEESVDLQYKMDAEAATGDIRRSQRQLRAAELANVYLSQGQLFAAAAAQAQTPEAQRILLSRAAGRFGGIASRTIMEAGGVDEEAAAAALATSADLAAIRAGIKTTAQLQHESDRATSVWLRNEIKSGNKAVAMWAAARGDKEAQYDLMERSLVTKEAQEDAAWAAREKELAYSPSQKARETEMGFRAIEASSATEAIYNTNDPLATAHGIKPAISAAGRYVNEAATYPFGSVGRRTMLQMARSSISGITPGAMGKLGMGEKEIRENTYAINSLTDKMAELEKSAPEGGSGFWTSLFGPTAAAGAVMALLKGAGTVMEGRTQWLADPLTPYQTRRDVRQGFAQNFGLAAAGIGAAAGAKGGAAIGTAIMPGVGTAVGALGGAVVGAIPGAVSYLLGTHYKDEKKIGDNWQSEAIKMARYYNLYGPGVDYNFSGAVQNTGYMSRESVLQLNQTADMLPGALSFGAVSEQQMMALSLAPNYYRALMEGASTSDIMEAYRQDMKNLPREYRQYITSILPGASEDLRAYVNSDYYGYLRAQNSTFYRGYDQDERGLIPGLESKRFEIAHANMESAHANAMTEIPNLNNANYNQPDKAFMMARMYSDNPYYAAPIVSPERASTAVSVAREISDSIAQVWGGKDTKLGDIIIQIDGDTVHSQEYGVQDFIRGNQSYVVGV